jgi:hypothetical protein
MKRPALTAFFLFLPVAAMAAEPAYDPFIAYPARILDGVGATIRFNSLPDTKMSSKGTQVSVNPLEAFVYKRIGPFSLGARIPMEINPDRSRDDFVLQVMTLDISAQATDGKVLRLYSGARIDLALNAGISDPKYPDRTVSHAFKTYLAAAVRFWGFSPQVNLMWHFPFRSTPYNGLWYQNSANGFTVDIVLPYYFEKEKVCVMLELNIDRDIDYGRTHFLVTPGVRFKPHIRHHFGVAAAIPAADDRFTSETGIGIITTYMYEFR